MLQKQPRKGTADLSTALRSGRDDKFVEQLADFRPEHVFLQQIVISTGA
jgi:hypothetical protein